MYLSVCLTGGTTLQDCRKPPGDAAGMQSSLAYGLVAAARVQPGEIVVDYMSGKGTIPIEVRHFSTWARLVS